MQQPGWLSGGLIWVNKTTIPKGRYKDRYVYRYIDEVIYVYFLKW